MEVFKPYKSKRALKLNKKYSIIVPWGENDKDNDVKMSEGKLGALQTSGV